MRMNIHNVVSVEIEKIEELPSCQTRTLIIRDDNGNKYEITLFADDAAALQIKA
jgi:hypothetical protein